MATPGFGDKILLVNLTTKEIIKLDTEKYEPYGGGHGMATALFWDFCVEPGGWDLQDAFHPKNMVALITGPVSGTGVPWGARTSVSGLSPQCYPIQWFSHSNFGGMFGTFMKMAGYTGIAVIGRADSPVYINVVDDKVTIEDAKDLWGLTTWKCQEEIWKKSGIHYGKEWQEIDDRYTLQRPAIVTIGSAGENKTRVASLIHGGGSGAGQGGFGGVFGSKNLKAIAFLGTKGIKIADPKGLKDAREWYDKTWPSGGGFGGFGGGGDVSSCCTACGQQRKCHNRTRAYSQDSDDCAESTWASLTKEDAKGLSPRGPEISLMNRKGTDIIQQLGINGMETCFQGPMSFSTSHNPDFPIQPEVPAYSALGWYMKRMYDMGIIGPGTKYDMSPLNMDKFPSMEFMEIYGIALANRYGIGNLLAEGTARFCEALGRTEDFKTLCRQTMWGFMDHWSLPGVDWAYGNLMDSRDINSHDMGMGNPSGGRFGGMGGGGKKWTCEEYVKVLAERTTGNNHFWFDFGWEGKQAYETGIFSRPKAEFVAWRMHYWTYYKESVGFCDWGYAKLFSAGHPKGYGHTSEAEPRYLNAVTGRNDTFQDGLEMGRRAWNLKRAIFALQGRHKKMENFTGYHYRPGASYCGYDTEKPVFDGKKWDWKNCKELYFTEDGVDQWKTHFYDVEGWNKDSGYPTRKTLEDLGMKHVADHMQSKNKLG
ncbi:aldehyde ferredoxin oxidoreductase N-terminal domain-containing protein [Thermodesulfobacteriota bacterium]